MFDTPINAPAPSPLLEGLPIADVLCVELVTSEALAEPARRGWRLATTGMVAGLRVKGGALAGRAPGPDGYPATLTTDGTDLDGTCSCPDWRNRASRRGNRRLCEHQVAIGLAALGYTSDPFVSAPALDATTIATIDHEQLAGLVATSLTRHSDLAGALEAALMANGTAPLDVATRRLVERPLPYYRQGQFERDCATLGSDLSAVFTQAARTTVSAPTWATAVDAVLELVNEGTVDDSYGCIGQAIDEGFAHYLTAAGRDGVPADEIAQQLATWSVDDGMGVADLARPSWVECVGAERLARAADRLAEIPDPPRPAIPGMLGTWERRCARAERRRQSARDLAEELRTPAPSRPHGPARRSVTAS